MSRKNNFVSLKRNFSLCLAFAAILCLALTAVVFSTSVDAYSGPGLYDDVTVVRLDDDSEILNNGYLQRYGVPTSQFTYSVNTGSEDGAPFDNAFDRNFNSVWRSGVYLNKNDPSTVSAVEVEFSEPTEIDRIVYQADSSWYDRGYFNKLGISYCADKTSSYVAYACLESEQTSSIVLVDLGRKLTVKRIKLEWLAVPTNHRTCAAASEIIFVQPQSDDVEAVQNMFTDYAQHELAPEISRHEDVDALRAKVRGYAAYDTELSYLLNRADQVLDGKVYFDARREMATDESSLNVLTRHGDVAGYARGTLKMAWFGTNRQVTGITASPDDELVVYVTAESGDPLPSLVVTQFWGSWASWKSGEYKLRLGKNVIRPMNYNQSGFTTNDGQPLPSGGPIYLVNPYTERDQSDAVKVYIEGGSLFPVFREGDDVGSYKNVLRDYAATVRSDRLQNAASKEYKVVDVTEIVSDHIIATVQSTLADVVYNDEGYSPSDATLNWDKYVEGLLKFDGVVFDEESEEAVGGRYDPRSAWLNCNVRLSQPYGAAYAYTEHVGIQVDWERTAITGGPGFGWGYSHELGHMMDMGERLVSECSNNMISKFHETVVELTASRGDFAKTTEALSPDLRIPSYWNTNRGNFIFWWLIESYHPGFWARLENRYRYTDVYEGFDEAQRKAMGNMNSTEKQVYLSSLVVGYDLSYYFDRWGYNLGTNDHIFEIDGENLSAAFKAVMAKAKEDGKISTDRSPKLWYLDAAEWWARYPDEDAANLYSPSTIPAIEAVTASDEGYNLVLSVDGMDQKAHLGFEISEGEGEDRKVVGFTYDQMFLDTTTYDDGYVPSYTVVAYDRALNASAPSKAKGPAVDEDVCRIGTRKFASLAEAVGAARDRDEIVILKDCYATGIVTDKELTISSFGAHVIHKGGPKPIFTVVRSGNAEDEFKVGKLTLKGSEDGKITLDGGGFLTSEPLVRVTAADFEAKWCEFRNNTLRRTSDALGGALRIENAGNNTTLISNCLFADNSARLGGAVYLNGGNNNAVFTSCTFLRNEAVEGGAAYSRFRGKFTDCDFSDCRADGVGGALANCLGGIIYVEGCNFSDCKAARGGAIFSDGTITISGGTFVRNEADEGAAICYARSTPNVRTFTAEDRDGQSIVISGNVSRQGAAVYLSGEAKFRAEVTGNDCLFALRAAGSVTITGGKVEGDIRKDAGEPIALAGSPFEVVGTCEVFLDTDTEETVFIRTSLDIDARYAAKFKVAKGDLTLRSDGNIREVVVALFTYRLTFVADGYKEERHVLPGREYVFDNYCGSERTYAVEWTSDGGEKFRPGQSLTVDRNMTFRATIADKVKVNFKFGNDELKEDFTIYVVHGESYTLEKFEFEKYILSGYTRGGVLYKPYATMTADIAEKEVTYTAELVKKLVVEYYVQFEGKDLYIGSRYFGFGDKITTINYSDEGVIPSGSYVSGYRVINPDGTAGELVDTSAFTVTSNLKLRAEVSVMPVFIIYSFVYGGKFLATDYDEVASGTDYTVSMRKVPLGYHITSLEFNGKYYAGDLDGFKIEHADSFEGYFITAYVDKNLYNIDYHYNGVYFKTESKKFGDELEFSDPTDTLLKEALGDKKYHFTSFQLVKDDPLADLEEAKRTVEINMSLGYKLTVTEDIAVNILVYIEGEETRDETDEDRIDRAEYNARLKSLADALVAEVSANNFDLSDDEQARFVTDIKQRLASAQSKIAVADDVAAMDEVVSEFKRELDEIAARARLAAAKNSAKATLRETRELAQRAFAATDEQAENALAAIEDIYTDALDDIAAATDAETVNDVVARATDNIYGIIDDYHGDVLVRQKEEAVASLRPIAESAGREIDGMEMLTDERKNAAKTELSAAQENATYQIARADDETLIAEIVRLFRSECAEIAGAASVQNQTKLDALRAIRSAVEETQARLDSAAEEACSRVDDETIIVSNEEIKGRMAARLTEVKAAAEQAVTTAEARLRNRSETDDLAVAVGAIAAETSEELESLCDDFVTELETYIRTAINEAREEAIRRDAVPYADKATSVVEEFAPADKGELLAAIGVALSEAESEIRAATTGEQIEGALDKLFERLDEIMRTASADFKSGAVARAEAKATEIRNSLAAIVPSDKKDAFDARVEIELRSALGDIDGATTKAQVDDVVAQMAVLLDALLNHASLLSQGNAISVPLTVDGIKVKSKTYDGSGKFEFDYSDVVIRNAQTGEPLSRDIASALTVKAQGELAVFGAGLRAVAIHSVTISGVYMDTEEYVVAEHVQTEAEIVIFKADLKVGVTRDGEIYYRGFVGGEDESCLTGEVKITYVNNEDGTRTATPSGVFSENYEIEFVAARLGASDDGDTAVILIVIFAVIVACAAASAAVVLILRKRSLR